MEKATTSKSGEIFLMIRRLKTTIFLEATDMDDVAELKHKLSYILKIPVSDIRLYKDNEILQDDSLLVSCGLTPETAKVQAPAMLGLALRQQQQNGAAANDVNEDTFEPLCITPLSSPTLDLSIAASSTVTEVMQNLRPTTSSV